ncbi:tyrosine-type recombinase/integrase [Kaistia granuli]|uniref:tyrosine-type recombinase/integrase n=1 Tax=Kaistia granuli TaxID=363259 RepID=UPI00036E241D|nr:tyrosine-type recombinase/integrase [Kaistia granuli]
MMESDRIVAALKQERTRRLQESRDRILATEYGRPVFATNYAGDPDEANQADIDGHETWIATLKTALAKRQWVAPDSLVRKSMDEYGVPESSYLEYRMAWVAMYISVMEQELEWLKNGPIDIDWHQAPLVDGPIVESVRSEPPSDFSDTRLKLSELASNFAELMRSTETWTGQTLAQSRATYRMFISHCGDRSASEYSRRDIASFYDVLRGLPALYSKKPEWNKLPLAEIAARTKDENIDRLSMTTIKRHFAALGGLFEHLRKRGEYLGENPAYGFDFPRGKRFRANAGREFWQGERLRDLFSSPVWSGCESESRRSSPGTLIIKDEKYWLPLLGLYHGNRLEEFAQLLRGDLRNDGGIWYLDINDEDDKQIKNAQSARRVPLHPNLVTMGFLDYVEQTTKAPTDRIFPQLKPGGPDRKYGYYFSKWWTRYRRDVGLYEKRLDYHSFRHGVTNKLFAADVPEAVVEMLTGHEGGGTSRKVYLKDLPLRRLQEAICLVDWPELSSLPHLNP